MTKSGEEMTRIGGRDKERKLHGEEQSKRALAHVSCNSGEIHRSRYPNAPRWENSKEGKEGGKISQDKGDDDLQSEQKSRWNVGLRKWKTPRCRAFLVLRSDIEMRRDEQRRAGLRYEI